MCYASQDEKQKLRLIAVGMEPANAEGFVRESPWPAWLWRLLLVLGIVAVALIVGLVRG